MSTKRIEEFWQSLPTTPTPSASEELWRRERCRRGVHISNRELSQVVAVAAIDCHIPCGDFLSEENTALIKPTALQLVEEFAAPLLPQFLSILC
jgi:hypothetical protein